MSDTFLTFVGDDPKQSTRRTKQKRLPNESQQLLSEILSMQFQYNIDSPRTQSCMNYCGFLPHQLVIKTRSNFPYDPISQVPEEKQFTQYLKQLRDNLITLIRIRKKLIRNQTQQVGRSQTNIIVTERTRPKFQPLRRNQKSQDEIQTQHQQYSISQVYLDEFNKKQLEKKIGSTLQRVLSLTEYHTKSKMDKAKSFNDKVQQKLDKRKLHQEEQLSLQYKKSQTFLEEFDKIPEKINQIRLTKREQKQSRQEKKSSQFKERYQYIQDTEENKFKELFEKMQTDPIIPLRVLQHSNAITLEQENPQQIKAFQGIDGKVKKRVQQLGEKFQKTIDNQIQIQKYTQDKIKLFMEQEDKKALQVQKTRETLNQKQILYQETIEQDVAKKMMTTQNNLMQLRQSKMEFKEQDEERKIFKHNQLLSKTLMQQRINKEKLLQKHNLMRERLIERKTQNFKEVDQRVKDKFLKRQKHEDQIWMAYQVAQNLDPLSLIEKLKEYNINVKLDPIKPPSPQKQKTLPKQI